jgi:hypothetical protein
MNANQEPTSRRPAGPAVPAEGARDEADLPAGADADAAQDDRSANRDDRHASDPAAPGTSVFDTESPEAVEPNEPA